MGFARKSREEERARRKRRVRRSVVGTSEKPRLCVFRSQRFTYAQLISDDDGRVLASASTRELKSSDKSTRCVESAKALGVRIGEIAKEKNITAVVFDRNGYIYHGRVAAVAEGARESGLQF